MKISKDKGPVPMPAKRGGGGRLGPLGTNLVRLAPGESLVAVGDRATIRSTAFTVARRKGLKLRTAAVPGGVRIWSLPA